MTYLVAVFNALFNNFQSILVTEFPSTKFAIVFVGSVCIMLLIVVIGMTVIRRKGLYNSEILKQSLQAGIISSQIAICRDDHCFLQREPVVLPTLIPGVVW